MTEIDANEMVVPGWDQASDGFAPAAERHPQLLRVWRSMRLVTWLTAVLQLLPLTILFAGRLMPNEAVPVAILICFSALMALTPWLATNLFNLFYPLLLCIAFWAVTGGLAAGDITGLMDVVVRFLSGLFYGLNTWEIWLLRVSMLAAAGQIGYKTVRLWRLSEADRVAVRCWWRRPKEDTEGALWS